MSLPACQQRILDRIENALQHREPRLVSMFAIFSRLTKDEGAPRTETLAPQRWWARLFSRLRFPGRGRHAGRPRVPAGGHRRSGRQTAVVRAVLLVPLVAAIVVSAILAGTSTSRISCPPNDGPHGPVVVQVHARNCSSASKLSGFGHGP